MFSKKKHTEIKNTGFSDILQLCRNIKKDNISDSEKILRLDFISEALKNDLKYERLMSTFCNTEENISNQLLIPLHAEDKTGSIIRIYNEDTKIIRSCDTCIISEVWKTDKLFKCLSMFSKEEFKYQYSNHFAYYYTEIDLCYVYNGNHSIAAADYFKKAEFPATVCYTQLLYPYVYTDGEYWYNYHSGTKKGKVRDFRAALLYEISKIKYSIEHNE